MTDNALVFCFENVAFREGILLFLLKDFFFLLFFQMNPLRFPPV